MPGQITWRTDEQLIARLRVHAQHHGLSMNEFITQVMRTVTDPAFAADPSEQVRERLRAAGLLAELHLDEAGASVDWHAVAEVGAESGRGTPLSDLVADGR